MAEITNAIEEIPEQPYGPGAICETCGHFATRHDENGCSGVTQPKGCVYGDEEGHACKIFLWQGVGWYKPWLSEGYVK